MDCKSDTTNDFTKDEEILQMEEAFCHCQTKCNVKIITFVWSITHFWDTCKFLDTLISSNVEEQPFKLQMCIDKKIEKISFYIYPIYKMPPNNIQKYNIYIDDTTRLIILTDWKKFNSCTESLCDVRFETIQQELSCLVNNTLSVYFTFQICESILNNIPNENILKPSRIITDDTMFSDESDLITVIINKQHFKVKRLLLQHANSKFFNDIFKKMKNEIELTNITYETFQLVMFYLESDGIFNFKLSTDRYGSYINKIYNLLVAANNLDMKDLKLLCESYLTVFTTKNNLVKHLKIAIENKAMYLENYIKRLINLHLDDIINTPEFTDIIENYPMMFPEILKQELLKKDILFSKSNDK